MHTNGANPILIVLFPPFARKVGLFLVRVCSVIALALRCFCPKLHPCVFSGHNRPKRRTIEHRREILHIAAHQGFIDRLNSFDIDFEKISLGTQDQVIFDLMEYLKEWLQIHILDCDRKIVRFINGEKITAED